MDHTPVVTPDTRTTVLQAFPEKHFITINGDVTGPAEAVIVLATRRTRTRTRRRRTRTRSRWSTSSTRPAPIVVGAAGNAGTGNVIGAVTGDATLSKTRVDGRQHRTRRRAGSPPSLALNEQIMYKKTGHYGLASSASSLLPKLPE